MSQNFTSIPGTTSVSGAVYAASANTITVGSSVYNVTGDSNVAASLSSLVGHNVTVAVDANGNVVNLVDAGSAANAVKTVSISGNNTVAVGQSEKLVAVGQDANGNAVSLPGSVSAAWSVAGSGAQVDSNGNFIASAAGTYTVTATINGVSATANVVVYGVAAAVKVTPASASPVANGVYSDTVTVSAVDASGNPVLNYNGKATVALSNTNAVTFATGTKQASDFDGTNLTFTNGVATVNVISGNTPGLASDVTVVLSQ